MIKFNTINFKISVLYVILLGLILMLSSGILYFSVRFTLYRDLDRDLLEKGREITELINAYLNVLGSDRRSAVIASRKVIRLEKIPFPQGAAGELEERFLRVVDAYDLQYDFVSLIDESGNSIARSREPFALAPDSFPHPGKALFVKTARRRPRYATVAHARLIQLPIVLKDGNSYVLQIATSIDDINRLLNEWLVFIGVSIPAILFFAGFLGRIFVVQILKPVKEIARTAKTISHEDLALRVKVEEADEEMRELILAFNDMISRLEASFKHIQEFSAQVAHELKTPLAVIRGESEVALRKKREPEEYQRVLEVNLRETQRMIKVIEDMLLLSRLEYESELYRFERFDLVEFLREIHEQCKILATPKQIDVAFRAQKECLIMKGDRLHLRRLFFNLIDNAIKFSPEKGKIDIGVSAEDGKIQVVVSDQGPGISPRDLPKIFEKFFHRDQSQDESVQGTGLGLSIAQSIARAHRGHIEVQNRLGHGADFSVLFPAA